MVLGQQRCATVEYQKLINPNWDERDFQFENWIENQNIRPKIRRFNTSRSSAATYVIPVVVHIIHNGEPIGTGTNISDAQVISQIEVLNEDFKRLNADASQTPTEFLPVAGSLDIEFVLAKQDPEGLATTGINRVQGTQTQWTLADNATFKALSYWPSEDYLNIWVINFNDPSNFIGYAQFPESPLPGLEDSSSDPLTDGVVFKYDVVGSIDDGPFDLDPQFNKGRTATHEIGHFFGLRHIWGDVSSCSGTDYVADTPPQSGETNGCPGHPQLSCSNNKMFQNYLDYTSDACMNLFTQGQIDRMEIVLQNSPRRASLTTSLGSQDPLPVANDLGLRSIEAPGISICGGIIVPSIEVRNYGTNTITSSQIEFKINGVVQQTKNFSLNLGNLEITTLTFDAINLPSPSTTTIGFEILQTNGTVDGKVSDNLLSHDAVVPVIADVPYFEFFTIAPADWIIENPDQRTTWENVNANNGTPGNKSMFINFYDYEEKGLEDRLLSPVLNLSGAEAALLRFDYSYAKFPGSAYNDKLRVLVVSNCDSDLSNAVEIFNKAGSQLSTTDDTFNAFAPSGASQWATEAISLNQFIDSGNIQLVFVGQNSNGNNLYLDNVFVLTGSITDVALKSVISPSPVTNKTNVSPVINIKNEGSVPITDFVVQTQVNGSFLPNKEISGLSLMTGEELEVTLDAFILNTGSNELVITISQPNGIADDAPSNNSINYSIVVNDFQETIPSRQDFNISFQESWTVISQLDQLNWELTTTNKGSSLIFRAFGYPIKGDEAWLVSPVLDFSDSYEASLFFDLSYATSFTGTERLRVLSSTDGGNTFNEIQFDQTGNQFATGNSSTSWTPVSDIDWKRQYINLNDLVGQSDVRLAFVATSDNGNNLYLDEIELYNDDNPSPPQTENSFSVYNEGTSAIKVTFNLPAKETSRIQIYNMVGQLVLDNELPNNLNQTYTFDLSAQQAGIYIVRVLAANEIGAVKVFIDN